MSARKSLLAFASAAALTASTLAFAPAVLQQRADGIDGKAQAVAAGAGIADGTTFGAAELPGLDCVAEQAGPFACNNVDLVDNVPVAAFGGVHGSDSWGWTDEDGTEYVIVTSGNGVGFFRLGEDGSAGYLGTLELSYIETPASGGLYGTLWHDVKVVNDHAYITAEDSGSGDQYGVQIVDMNRIAELDEVALDVEQTIEEDGFLGDGLAGHNMVGFPERDLIGIVLGEHAECGGNLAFYDVADTPLEPAFVGCAWDESAMGYVDTPHDAHCVVYAGPDLDYYDAGPDGVKGTEDDVAHDLCALFNQYNGGLVIVDTTALTRDGTSTRATFVNRFDYATRNYTHQGWFSPNHRWVMFNDELDESGALALALGGSNVGPSGNNRNTTTYYVDISDLDVKGAGLPAASQYNADKVKAWSNPNTIAIDHNMYPVEVDADTGRGLLFQANYGAGLRVLEYTDASLAAGGPDAFTEVAYFDTYPGPGPAEFYGAWNVYPFFESGNIIVSDFQSGLLVLDVHDEVYAD